MRRLTVLFLSFVTVFALSVSPEPYAAESTLDAFQHLFVISPLFHALLLGVFYIAYNRIFELSDITSLSKREKLCRFIPALLFSAFVIVGHSYYKHDNLSLITANGFQLLKALIAFVGLGIMFFMCIVLLFHLSGKTRFKKLPDTANGTGNSLWSKYVHALTTRPFMTAFVTLLIAYIPNCVLNYPMICMGDTVDIICQPYQMTPHLSFLHLIDEAVTLNDAHPVVYTLYIHTCLMLGLKLFGSASVGMFISSLIQLLLSLAVFSLAIKLAVRLKARLAVVVTMLLFFAFCPHIQEYMMISTKDILYACGMLMLYLCLFCVLRNDSGGKRLWLCFAFSLVLMFFTRNDGKLTICASLLLASFSAAKKPRVIFLSSLVSVLVLSVLMSSVILPAYHITPGSKREMLSVPFQQTARYVSECADEVTEDERSAISAVLDYDSLAENYYPRKSDPVKATFNEDADSEAILSYLKVWLRMFFKHPRVYLEAFLNNYYNYFYPGPELTFSDSSSYTEMNFDGYYRYTDLKDYGIVFTLPEWLNTPRTIFENVREALFTFPVFSFFKSTAVIVWAYLLLIFYLIEKKQGILLLTTAPIFFEIAKCFLAPCNGDYFRYAYGIAVCVPIAILLSLTAHEPNTES